MTAHSRKTSRATARRAHKKTTSGRKKTGLHRLLTAEGWKRLMTMSHSKHKRAKAAR